MIRETVMEPQMIRPFHFEAANDELDDLKARIGRARLPVVEREGWGFGMPPDHLARILAYWREKFDWRREEASLRKFPQFVATVGSNEVHFVHVRGDAPNSYPLILSHGWPSSFLEFLPMVGELTKSHLGPSGEPFSFDVVIPSLPGFGFSSGPLGDYVEIAKLWVQLMSALGYERFGAHGGDIGAKVTSRLGLYFPDHVEAIHVLSVPKFIPGTGEFSADEALYAEYWRWWQEWEGGYDHQQRTRPYTLGAALNDSPAGLAAWIIEKWHAWSDPHTDVEESVGLDFLLANVTLYWLTSTITSSMETYWHHEYGPRAAWPDRMVEIPSRLLLSTEVVDLIPECAAKRVYSKLDYARVPRGGHFLAAEEPALLADDLRQFFSRFARADSAEE